MKADFHPYYILDENDVPVPVTAEACLLWKGEHFATRGVLAKDNLGSYEAGYFVATVFTGHNHNFTGEGPPLLWETTAASLKRTITRRYATKAEATKGHGEVVREVLDELAGLDPS